MEKAVEDAIKRAITGTKDGRCWARLLQGEPLEFIQALEDLEEDSTVHVSRAQVSRDFMEVFTLQISEGQVTDHLSRKCACRPKN